MHGIITEAVIVALITAGVPSIVSLVLGFKQNNAQKKMQQELESQAEKHSAKQSILQMVMEDQFAYEVNHKFPVNYARIQDEYAVYHANGGNGEVTKKVMEYTEWYAVVEAKLKDTNNNKEQ